MDTQVSSVHLRVFRDYAYTDKSYGQVGYKFGIRTDQTFLIVKKVEKRLRKCLTRMNNWHKLPVSPELLKTRPDFSEKAISYLESIILGLGTRNPGEKIPQ